MAEVHSRIDIDAFFPGVRVEVPEAPQALLLFHTRQAAISFCERSKYWVEPLESITVLAGVSKYDLTAPTDTNLVEVTKATVVINGESRDILSEKYYRGRLRYWQENPTSIEFDPVEKLELSTIELTAALKPTQTQNQISELVYNDYYETIVTGAKARLLLMPNKEWSNPQLGNVLSSKFDYSSDEAMRRARRGFKVSPQRPRQSARNYF